jgi:tetratricopeptide (TPR) repeat protein
MHIACKFILLLPGNCYRKMNQLENTIKDYEQARDIDSTKAYVHDNLGVCYIESGYYDLSIASFSYAVDLERGEGE